MAVNFGSSNSDSAVPRISYKNISNVTLNLNVAGVIYSVAPRSSITVNLADAYNSQDIQNALSAFQLRALNSFGVPITTPTPPPQPQVITINQQVPATNVGGFTGIITDQDGYWVLQDGNTLIYPNNKTRRQPAPGANSVTTCAAQMRRQDSQTGNLGFALYTDTQTDELTFQNGYLVHWLADGTGAVYRVVDGTRIPLAISQENKYPQDEHYHKFSVSTLQPYPGQLEFFMYTDGVLVAQAIDLNDGFISGAIGFSTSEGSSPVYVSPNSFEYTLGVEEYYMLPLAVQNAVTELSTLSLQISGFTGGANASGLNSKNLIPDSGFVFGHVYWSFEFAGSLAIENAVGADGGNGVVYTQGGSPGNAGNIFINTDNTVLIPLKGGKTYCLSMNIDATNVIAGGPTLNLYSADLTTQLATVQQSPGVNGIIEVDYTVPGTTLKDVAVLVSMDNCVVAANSSVIVSIPQLELGTTRTKYQQTLVPDTEPVIRHTIHSTQVQSTISGAAGPDSSFLYPGVVTSRHFVNATPTDYTTVWDGSASRFLHNKMSSGLQTAITIDGKVVGSIYDGITFLTPANLTNVVSVTAGGSLKLDKGIGTLPRANTDPSITEAVLQSSDLVHTVFSNVSLRTDGVLVGFMASGTSSTTSYVIDPSAGGGAGVIVAECNIKLPPNATSAAELIIGNTVNGYGLRWDTDTSIIVYRYKVGSAAPLGTIALSGAGPSFDTNWHTFRITVDNALYGTGLPTVEASFDTVYLMTPTVDVTSPAWTANDVPITVKAGGIAGLVEDFNAGNRHLFLDASYPYTQIASPVADSNFSYLNAGVVFDNQVNASASINSSKINLSSVTQNVVIPASNTATVTNNYGSTAGFRVKSSIWDSPLATAKNVNWDIKSDTTGSFNLVNTNNITDGNMNTIISLGISDFALANLGGSFHAGELAPPSTPNTSTVSLGSLSSTTYYVKTTYVTQTGETLPSSEATQSATANKVLQVSSPNSSGGAIAWNVYVGNTGSGGAGSETFQATMPIGIAWQEPTSGIVSTGSTVPTFNTAIGTFGFEDNSGNLLSTAYYGYYAAATSGPILSSPVQGGTQGYCTAVFNGSGAIISATTPCHMEMGHITATGTTTVVQLTGQSAFTNASSYVVTVIQSNALSPTAPANVRILSGSSFEFTSSNTDQYNWIAIGH